MPSTGTTFKCIARPVVLRLALLAVSLATAAAPQAARAQYEQLAGDPSPFSDAALVSEQDWIKPGVPFTVGVRLVMEEGWHSYWKNPGDSGEPIEITWTLPAGFSAGPIQWPFPEKIDGGPLRSYGYADEVLFLTDITPPADLSPGSTVDIAATADWLICADVCLFAEQAVSLSLPAQSDSPDSGIESEEFAQARSRLPVTLAGWDIQAVSYSQSFALRVTPPSGAQADLGGAYFFPDEPLVLEHAVDQPMSRDGESFLFALQQSEYATGTPERLEGVLVTGEGQFLNESSTYRALAIDVPIQVASGQSSAASSPSLLLLLAFALAGGLLLNLMPCVFPILSIKVLGFAQHGDLKARAIRRHGFVFAAAVVVSFWVLAGLFLSLRAAGNQIGWGFQLQSPLFVAGMAFLFFSIGLNLLGVFEVGVLSGRWVTKAFSRGGYQRSFWDGALATLVATPCTAPFMGAALGAAIALPPIEALLIFTLLGVGMAAPYVGLTMMPKLLGMLPRPGAWMETLKHILAFPMIATTIWMAWVFGSQVGIDGVAFLLVGLLFLGIALWILGRWPAPQVSQHIRLLTRSVAFLAILLSLYSGYQGAQYITVSASESAAQSTEWQRYSTASVEALRAEGRAVFVDFTAAWCLTCQVNKRTTLSSEAVEAAFKQKGVVLMRADWTNRDDEITRALESHGRSGVPLYVLYPSNQGRATLLPEVLTEPEILAALEPLPDWLATSDQKSL